MCRAAGVSGIWVFESLLEDKADKGFPTWTGRIRDAFRSTGYWTKDSEAWGVEVPVMDNDDDDDHGSW